MLRHDPKIDWGFQRQPSSEGNGGGVRSGWCSAVIYSIVGTCPCRMRHGQVHAERLTMPNEALREAISPGFANVRFGIV